MEQSGWYVAYNDVFEIIDFIDKLESVIEEQKDTEDSLDKQVNLRLDEGTKNLLKVCLSHGLKNGYIRLSKDMRILIKYTFT